MTPDQTRSATAATHGSVPALRDCRPQLAAAWASAVHRSPVQGVGPTAGPVTEAVGTAVDRMAAALDDPRPDAAARLAEQARDHGADRFAQRYTVAELMAEYQVLRRVVFEQLAAALAAPLIDGERAAMNRAVDAVAAGGVAAFVDAQRQHLASAAELQGRFLAYLAHDQRNHLNHALLLIEVHTVEVAQHPDLADSLADLALVREAIGQTAAGMERLMEAERLRQVAGQAERRTFAVAELLRSVADVHAGPAAAKAIGVCVDGPPDGTITSDPDLIRLALNNLVGNAIKFSTAGTVRLCGSGPDAEGRWRLSVADDGPGIAADRIGQLFDAFARGDTHGQPGMGLGLSIAADAARLLGGGLDVASTVGVGSTFTLTVPGGPVDVPRA